MRNETKTFIYNFTELTEMGNTTLTALRDNLRDCIAEEIAKADKIKGEILWLQNELIRMRQGQ